LKRGPWRGRLLIPCDHSVVTPEDPTGYNSHVIFSDDHGKTWQLGGAIRPAVNECQVVELTDGTVLMNMRNYDPSRNTRAIATSRDGGLTWSEVGHDPVLVEPICQASLVRYDFWPEGGQDCLLFSNPAHGRTGVRRDMTVRLSRDGGKTWPIERLLWPGPTAYSCLAVRPDGTIASLFEGGRENPYERILVARFGLPWLTGRPLEP
jgi:sialidase-1